MTHKDVILLSTLSLSHAGQFEKGDHVDQRHSQWGTSCKKCHNKTSTVQIEARDKFVENFVGGKFVWKTC